MAKNEETQTPTPTPRKDRRIVVLEETLDVPQLVKTSKYPWDALTEGAPLSKNFFVECDSKEEAEQIRSSVFSSGRNFYLKRHIPLRPECRVMQVGEAWGVVCWAKPDEPKKDKPAPKS